MSVELKDSSFVGFSTIWVKDILCNDMGQYASNWHSSGFYRMLESHSI